MKTHLRFNYLKVAKHPTLIPDNESASRCYPANSGIQLGHITDVAPKRDGITLVMTTTLFISIT